MISEELDIYFDTDGLGETITIERPNRTFSTSITAIFDKAFTEIESGTPGWSGHQPIAYAKTSDVSSVQRGDILTRNEVEYTIVDLQTDGLGVTTLVLENG
jgi:hypothetical protein